MKSNTEKREYFEALVAKAEQEITQDPKAYQGRLKRLAYVGYGIIFLLLGTLLILIGGAAWLAFASSTLFILLVKKKFIIIIGALVWVIARSLFVKVAAPEGLALERKDFPILWNEVDQLTQATGSAKVHRIIMTPELNAAMAQTPRFGIMGPYKNTLVVGLEVMMALSQDQLRAVLAHEMAHLSGSHSRFSSWIYRARLSWLKVRDAFENSNAWGTGLIRRFVSWYVPYFTGYSYVLARNNEYEADALAAKLTSPESTGSALVTVMASGDVVRQKFWQPLYDSAYVLPSPDGNVYSKLKTFYEQSSREDVAYQQALRQSLDEQPYSTDTHPSLAQRLEALQCGDAGFSTGEDSAMQWLGEQSGRVIDHFNQEWTEDNKDRWEDFYQTAVEARQCVEGYAKKDYDVLNEQEKWHYAELTERYLPDEDALPLYQRYQQAHPDDLDADFVIGRLLLLDKGDDAGMAYIEKCRANPHMRSQTAEVALEYYSRVGDKDAASQWLIEYEAAQDILEQANEERTRVTGSDSLFEPELSEAVQTALLHTLHHDDKVKEVWVSQKYMEHFPDRPMLVICIKTRGFIFNKEAWFEKLCEGYESGFSVYLTTKAIDAGLSKAVVKNGVQIFTR